MQSLTSLSHKDQQSQTMSKEALLRGAEKSVAVHAEEAAIAIPTPVILSPEDIAMLIEEDVNTSETESESLEQWTVLGVLKWLIFVGIFLGAGLVTAHLAEYTLNNDTFNIIRWKAENKFYSIVQFKSNRNRMEFYTTSKAETQSIDQNTINWSQKMQKLKANLDLHKELDLLNREIARLQFKNRPQIQERYRLRAINIQLPRAVAAEQKFIQANVKKAYFAMVEVEVREHMKKIVKNVTDAKAKTIPIFKTSMIQNEAALAIFSRMLIISLFLALSLVTKPATAL